MILTLHKTLADQIRIRLVRHVASMGEKRNSYRILVEKPKIRLRYKGWIIRELNNIKNIAKLYIKYFSVVNVIVEVPDTKCNFSACVRPRNTNF